LEDRNVTQIQLQAHALSCSVSHNLSYRRLFSDPRGDCRCSELRFTLQPGGSHDFILPLAQSPVHIEVSFTLNNGGTQEPRELMYAVVNQDPASKQITWIGTNSDGSSSGSSSLKGKTIASIFGGGPGTTNASMNVAAAPTRTLSINQNASTTTKPGEYVVRIYF